MAKKSEDQVVDEIVASEEGADAPEDGTIKAVDVDPDIAPDEPKGYEESADARSEKPADLAEKPEDFDECPWKYLVVTNAQGWVIRYDPA